MTAGNIIRSLNKNILKVISCEINESCRLHDDVMLELMLTQKIIKDTDLSYIRIYCTDLQVDPFGVYLYTGTGLVILVQNLRKGHPATLHLDATGGVVSWIPNQPKRVLYYSINLPGHGQDTPPLPVSEMITNDHTIPNVSFWLHRTIIKIRKLTVYNIYQVETDYRWALIHNALLSFSKQAIHTYLMESYNLVKGNVTMTNLRWLSVLHLCSAHIIKAVQGAIGKGLKEFSTHCVAQLINTTSLKKALDIFKSMCHIFYPKAKTECVNQCLQELHDHIRWIKIPEADSGYSIPPEANTILARSPFTKEFSSVHVYWRSWGGNRNKQKQISLFRDIGCSDERLLTNFSTLVRDYAWWQWPTENTWHKLSCWKLVLHCQNKIIQKKIPSPSSIHTKNVCLITR